MMPGDLSCRTAPWTGHVSAIIPDPSIVSLHLIVADGPEPHLGGEDGRQGGNLDRRMELRRHGRRVQ